jgi:hypothetical protein
MESRRTKELEWLDDPLQLYNSGYCPVMLSRGLVSKIVQILDLPGYMFYDVRQFTESVFYVDIRSNHNYRYKMELDHENLVITYNDPNDYHTESLRFRICQQSFLLEDV